MKKINMGVVDQVIRVLVAAILSILYFTNVISGGIGIAMLVLSIILLSTGIVRICPLYILFGISTCKTN